MDQGNIDSDEFMVFALSEGYHLPWIKATPQPPFPTLDAAHADGCTATGSLFTIDQTTPLHHQPWQDWMSSTSLFRPVGNPDLTVVLSPIYSWYQPTVGEEEGLPALRCQASARDCIGYFVESPHWLWPLDLRFSPSNHDVFAVLARTNKEVLTSDGTYRAALSLFTYDVSRIDWDRPPVATEPHRFARLGPALAHYYIGQERDVHRWNATRLLYSPDGSEVLVLGFDGESRYSSGALVRVDAATMSEVRPPIAFDARFGQYGTLLDRPVFWHNEDVANMDVDPTGRFVVFARWETATIGVIDLATEQSWTLPVPGFEADEDYLVLKGNAVGNVSFNKTEHNHGLLAIHGLDRVGVYALTSDGHSLVRLDLKPVPRNLIYAKDGPGGPVPRGWTSGPIDWTGDGRYLVAAGAAEGPEEVHSWQVASDGRMLDHRTYEACTVGYNRVFGIITHNGLMPTSTPTPTKPGDPTHTPTPSATPRPTRTASATPTHTPPPSPTPARAYLPLMLREQCIPESKQFDVVLLVDASTSMGGDGGDGSSRSKLQAAVDAARVLLDELRLGPSSAATLDRAGIITFHARVDLLQGLTQDRVALLAALSSITLAQGSQLDLGLDGATEELLGPRRRLGADRVIVVLTDGRATGGPQAALGRADVAKARGITIFTVGLGADLDREALVGIASRPELCTLLPNAAELSSVFQAIGRDLPCPKWDYWGRR